MQLNAAVKYLIYIVVAISIGQSKLEVLNLKRLKHWLWSKAFTLKVITPLELELSQVLQRLEAYH
ncbi:hypothetical protein NBRC116592_17220 [Colwellia sp. KU-HH00111]